MMLGTWPGEPMPGIDDMCGNYDEHDKAYLISWVCNVWLFLFYHGAAAG
jgi:hypothetical protein